VKTRLIFLLQVFFALLVSGTTLVAAPKRLLLIGQGPDGHPPGTHEFMAGVRVVSELLKPFANDIQVTTAKADEPWTEGPQLIDRADGIVLLVTQGARWMQTDAARHAALKRLAARKGAMVALHWSIGAQDGQYIAGQLALLGGTRGGPQRKYKVLENDVHLAERDHPILRGLSDFRIKDEFYYRLDLVPPSPAFHPLLETPIDGNDETICWAWERPDGGRSVGYVGIHFHSNWERLEYRRLVTQAILWTFALPIPESGVPADISKEIFVLPAK
jgi:type 1 glutamine amidotransferase